MFLFRLSLVGLFLVAAGVVAEAGGFDDFNQGIAARNRGDVDTEILAFTHALAASDLAPSLRTVALFDRGTAYASIDQQPAALADLSEVIKVRPDQFDARERRAAIYEGTAEFAAALPDCEALIGLRPRKADLFSWCARIAYKAGHYDQATTYFKHAMALDDRLATYDWLWLALSGLRTGKQPDGTLENLAASLDGTMWPAPIVNFFRGRIGEDDLTRAAATGNAVTQRNQQCEVGFYLGEWTLAYRNIARAKSLLRQAVDLCPPDYFELQPAKLELKQLG